LELIKGLYVALVVETRKLGSTFPSSLLL